VIRHRKVSTNGLSISMSALVLMSGGVDSYACAHFLKTSGHRPMGLFVNYGQAALRRERTALKRIAKRLKVKTIEISLDLNRPFGEGEVPGRNGLFAMAAIAASPKGTSLIAMGIHAGTPYYDCSQLFVERMDDFIREYSQGAIRFAAPFSDWSKSQIFDYCYNSNLDIALSYSCERGGNPCGSCSSCQDRTRHDAR
jgi:7-cyano-7-deazaguanine synthase